MNDILTNIRTFLLSKSAIITIVGNAVYPNWYPEGVNPVDSPFIVVRLTNGDLSNEAPVRDCEIEIRSYHATDKKAHDLDDLIMTTLCGVNRTSDYDAYMSEIGGYGFEFFNCSSVGKIIRDPDFKWIYSLAGYETRINN